MKSALNLLPVAYRRKRLARRRVIQWSFVLLATVSAILLARWYKSWEYGTLRERLEAIAREARPGQSMLREIAGMRGRIDRLQKHESVAQELEQQRQVLALLGVVSQAARRTGGRLRVTDCRVVGLQAVAAVPTATDGAQPEGTVTLVGVAIDSPAVAEFHDSLVQCGLFADVKLIKSIEQAELGTALYEYEVRCEL